MLLIFNSTHSSHVERKDPTVISMSGFNEKFPKQMSLVSHYPRPLAPTPHSISRTQISWKLKIPFIFQENKQAMAISDCSSIFMNFCWLFRGGVHRMSNLYFGVKASWQQVLLPLQKAENYSLGETFFSRGWLNVARLQRSIDPEKPNRDTTPQIDFPLDLEDCTSKALVNVVVVASRTNSNLEPINLKRHHSQLCQLWSCFNPEEEAKEGKSL